MDPSSYDSTRGKAAIIARLKRMSAAQRREMTEAARAAQRRKIEQEIDPSGELTPEELERRVRYAISARPLGGVRCSGLTRPVGVRSRGVAVPSRSGLQ